MSKYKKGDYITVNDKMQTNYKYQLSSSPGKDFDPSFTPKLTPAQMLKLGVFEGKYMNDCVNEFPVEWFNNAKISLDKPDANLNLFKIKSRLSLTEWRKRGWIPVHQTDKDVRGWFQWYARYWLGRRQPDCDKIQIKRWRAFVRHKAQVTHDAHRKGIKTKKDIIANKHRYKQRQALLQWAYDPWVV